MASNKYFLFRTSEVTEYSDVFSDEGDNLSLLSISTDHVSYITAKKGVVVFVFNNASLYENFQGAAREALTKTRMEVSCEVGEEFKLVKKITEYITNPSPTRRVLEFDAVNSSSSFRESKPSVIKPLLPKQPVIMSTQAVSNDPASIDLTQTTTTTIAGITYPSPSFMPIIDYNETELPSDGTAINASNNWDNSGSGGATYNITSSTTETIGSTTFPIVDRTNGTSVNAAADISAGSKLTMANALEIDGAYTIYMVVGTLGYASFGHSILDNGHTHIGFAANAGAENTSSEFWVRHNTSSLVRPAYMTLNATLDNTVAYQYPDPSLDGPDANTAGFEGQHTYVFVLRRDKDFNLYLHNHTGDIVGYAGSLTGSGDFATDGTLKIDDIGTGFRGFLPRIGVIGSDIGGSSASKLAKDLFKKYRLVL